MRIEHLRSTGSVSADVHAPVALFLRNTAGWFSQYTRRQSRYEGLYLTDYDTQPNRMFKLLERIEILDSTGAALAPQTMRIGEASTQLAFPNTVATFQIPGGGCGLRMLCTIGVPIRLSLDMREIYAQPDTERIYSAEHYGDGLLISYTDPFLAERTLYLHIRGLAWEYSNSLVEDLHAAATWQEAIYPRDAARNSYPDRCYTFVLPPTHAQTLSFGGAWTREEAAAASWAAWAQPNIEPSTSSHETSAVEVAKSAVQQSLWWLRTDAGYYAGYPWFHQIWSRDELITALGLPPEEQIAMIRRYLTLPILHGELPTFAGSGSTCADGVGWLALLIREHGLVNLEESDRESARKLFVEAVRQLRAERQSPSGLIHSGWNATWMDTIGRTGYRIEIQAMYSLVLQLLAELTNDSTESQRWHSEWQEAMHAIRHRYYSDGYLVDGFEENQEVDPRKRPNVFLAYLLQPDLLNQSEWESCMEVVAAACATTWGGLTSLERVDSAFQPVSTGQDNRSYHNGDSWFFVNNLAALAMWRCNQQKFSVQIEELITSSTSEVLWQNILGCAGEIASASDGTSWGCGVQGFSGGGYVAALAEINVPSLHHYHG